MSQQVKNGIEILKIALQEGISCKKASSKKGFNEIYLTDVKRRISTLFNNGKVNKELFDEFNSLLEEYNNTYDPRNPNSNTKIKDTNLDIDEKYDERSKSWANRGDDNKIISYGYSILVRDEPSEEGELTTQQMETIYQNYPYVTRNSISMYFPYLTYPTLKRILRVFNITKDKKFPQHILENYNEEQIAEFALKAKEFSAEKKIVEYKPIFIEAELRKAQKKIFDMQEDKKWIDEIVEKYVKRDVNIFSDKIIKKEKKNTKENIAYCLFSDIHYGKKFNSPIFGRGYNKDIAHERVMQIVDELIKYVKLNNSNKIVICFLGDLLESITEKPMHSGHWKGMDLEGDDQLFFAVDSFKEMISRIKKEFKNIEIDLFFLPGNHDRIGEKRDDDKYRTAAKIAFKILKREIENEYIKIIIPENNIIRNKYNNLFLIGFHGDNSLVKKQPHELVNLYGVGSSAYHLVISGHFHRTKINTGTNYINFSLPSVASTDEFILGELGNNDLPGFLLGKESEHYGFDYNVIRLY